MAIFCLFSLILGISLSGWCVELLGKFDYLCVAGLAGGFFCCFFCSTRVIFKRICLLIVICSMGFGLFSLKLWLHRANIERSQQVPGQVLSITGDIESVSGRHGHSVSFILAVPTGRLHGRWLLRWYQVKKNILPGMRCHLNVRVSPWRSMSSLSYQSYLITNRISNRGVVYSSASLGQSSCQLAGQVGVNHLRGMVISHILATLGRSEISAILSGLILGSRALFDKSLWLVLQKTGTAHLVAISGLHLSWVVLGLVGCLFFWLLKLLMVSYRYGLLFNLFSIFILGMGYCCLTGMAIPTIRALLMVILLSLSAFSGWLISLTDMVIVTGFLLLLINPQWVYSISFCLSFSAVLWISYGHSRSFMRSHQQLGLIKAQLFVTVGLLPLVIYYFHQFSIVSVLANWIAVPWFAFLVLPVGLLAFFSLLCFPFMADHLWRLVKLLMFPLWVDLNWFATLPWAVLPIYLSFFEASLLFLALLVMFVPLGVPGRWVSIFVLLPVIFGVITWSVPVGRVDMRLWSLRHGVAVIFQVRHHAYVWRWRVAEDDMKRYVYPDIGYRLWRPPIELGGSIFHHQADLLSDQFVKLDGVSFFRPIVRSGVHTDSGLAAGWLWLETSQGAVALVMSNFRSACGWVKSRYVQHSPGLTQFHVIIPSIKQSKRDAVACLAQFPIVEIAAAGMGGNQGVKNIEDVINIHGKV